MMNPFHAAASWLVVKGRLRVCPKCAHKQIVSSHDHGHPVRCRHCGADIPPAADQKRP